MSPSGVSYTTGDIASEWFTGTGYQLGALWTESSDDRILPDDTTRTETGFAGHACKFLIPNGADANLRLDMAAAYAEVYVRFFLYIGTWNRANAQCFFTMGANGIAFNNPVAAMHIKMGGTASPYDLTLYIDGTSRDTATITSGESHLIELYIGNKGAGNIENGGSDGWVWWIDDVKLGEGTNDPGQNVQDIIIGNDYTGAETTFWIDHFDVSSTRLDQ